MSFVWLRTCVDGFILWIQPGCFPQLIGDVGRSRSCPRRRRWSWWERGRWMVSIFVFWYTATILSACLYSENDFGTFGGDLRLRFEGWRKEMGSIFRYLPRGEVYTFLKRDKWGKMVGSWKQRRTSGLVINVPLLQVELRCRWENEMQHCEWMKEDKSTI